ncbi:lipid IV(A) 3-deoxy-D-manno-octulosonic acid transferase [Shewanella sp. 6_MG-2023]|uniref:lipid IV(A) 3-deoxy-D-manno-octulosonic acid transferase n=1 Tax=Shewanella sp. 6_MG-2023 TaxID=3062660 RepID=UPI0026E291B0|nr:lipid IV(A) 3-deoxy-D-manno-octulosonic acid transferase [Shewanella sp. 6_MG-2023]MDO6620000.1 lipid IV(A) 3-deoxy-D-manno-octulosonic acid transferase [Shewanella sp. 6_MG-2023]
MTRGVYSVLLLLLSPLIVAYLAFRAFKSPDYRGRWGERFGLMRLKQTDVLIHSVSMGETLAAIPLIKRLMKQHPQLSFTVTTTSPTGSAEVKKAFGDSVQHCYLPFDINLCVSRFIKQVNPQLCVIMETELWPNLLHYAKKNNTRLVLANARLSQKSADKYHKQMGLSLPMLTALDAIAVQTEAESARFAALGANTQSLHVCGSLKFDIQIDDSKYQQAKTLRADWNRSQAPVWVAGSVHPGEFDMMLQAHKKVLEQYPDALLIMAPRHPEQFNVAAVSTTQQGLNLARRSMNEVVEQHTQVLLGDTMGELLMLYGAADVAFIGGTLIESGGHNPLEPAAMGLPVSVGPHHWNFAEITHLLEQAGGLTVVNNADELADMLLKLFANVELHNSAAKASLAVVSQNRGALQKQFEIVEQQLRFTQLIS